MPGCGAGLTGQRSRSQLAQPKCRPPIVATRGLAALQLSLMDDGCGRPVMAYCRGHPTRPLASRHPLVRVSHLVHHQEELPA